MRMHSTCAPTSACVPRSLAVSPFLREINWQFEVLSVEKAPSYVNDGRWIVKSRNLDTGMT